jgi:hypothetical protein
MMWLTPLLALALSTTPQSWVGKTYAETVKETAFDPVMKAISPVARQTFMDTLNGPQTPGIFVRRGNRELVVFETCTAHMCAYEHSVIAVEVYSQRVYAAVYSDAGKTIVVPDIAIEGLIGHACDGNRCDFDDAY